MTTNRTTLLACLLPAAVLLPAPALALDWYAGLAGGSSRADASALADGYTQDQSGVIPRTNVADVHSSESRGAWKVLAGCKPHRNLALEVSYTDYGHQGLGFTGRYNRPFGPPIFAALQQVREAKRTVEAWGIDLFGVWPVAPEVELLAGIGAARARVRLDESGTDRNSLGTVSSIGSTWTSNHTVARFTVGANWKPASQWAVRLAYEQLADAGTDFQPGNDAHTGRSSQRTLWLGATRSF